VCVRGCAVFNSVSLNSIALFDHRSVVKFCLSHAIFVVCVLARIAWHGRLCIRCQGKTQIRPQTMSQSKIQQLSINMQTNVKKKKKNKKKTKKKKKKQNSGATSIGSATLCDQENPIQEQRQRDEQQ
jgi:hypothetical protein